MTSGGSSHKSDVCDWLKICNIITPSDKSNCNMASGEQQQSEITIIENKLSDEKKMYLIKDLEKFPCLWNTGSKDYKNKQEKAKASELLGEKYSIDGLTLKTVLHGLRTSLMREIKKENEGRQSKWKFLEALAFMKEDVTRHSKEKETQVWSSEENEKLIDFYRENEELWNHHLQSYRDRALREAKMKNMQDELFPERTIDEIKKQWQMLKTIFQRELKRQESSKSSGSGTSSVYNSNWKHFNSMMFLKGSDDLDSQVSTLQMQADTENNEKPFKRSRHSAKKETPTKEFEEAKLELYKQAIKCLQMPLPVGPTTSEPTVTNDDITMFLKNIEATLRQFPGKLLTLAKRKIYEVVSDLEMELHNDPPHPFSASNTMLQPARPTRVPLGEIPPNISWPYSSNSILQL